MKVNLESRGVSRTLVVERVGFQGKTRPAGTGEQHTISRIVDGILVVLEEEQGFQRARKVEDPRDEIGKQKEPDRRRREVEERLSGERSEKREDQQ